MAEMTIVPVETPVTTHGFFIDGRWVQDGDAVEVRSPFNGSVVGRVTQGRREHAAAAIAAGQLDRRIPERDSRTEVGRLSAALNGMLAQIQEAVASSEASAQRHSSPRAGCVASSPTPATNCAHR